MPQTTAPHARETQNIVVIGGGTGSFTVLSGLRHLPYQLSAIVTMADDGGSTGRLRDEYGVLPPGDLRQCLVALSDADHTLRTLFNHRYDKGELAGHSFGNLFLSTLEQTTGSLDRALEVAGEILRIRGRVIPVTLSKVDLVTELKNGKVIHGESALGDYQLLSRFGVRKIQLSPKPSANPKAIRAILEADAIIVGPGNLYRSLLPNFLVPGIGAALKKAKGKKIYVANLMNKNGHTDDFSVSDHVRVLEDAIGKRGVFDTVVHNTKRPPQALLKKYADEGTPVTLTPECLSASFELVGANLLSETLGTQKKHDIYRTLIRHDQEKLASLLERVLTN